MCSTREPFWQSGTRDKGGGFSQRGAPLSLGRGLGKKKKILKKKMLKISAIDSSIPESIYLRERENPLPIFGVVVLTHTQVLN